MDAVLDLWDLSPGKDLVAFMERGISSADRVVVVCTENYSEKADNGRGGVGYEKLILTGELVQDLDSSKFIPLVRSSTRPPPLPRFLGTRLYIDFTDDSDYEEQFETLLRELHQAPRLKKPELGTNPFLEKRTTEEEGSSPTEKPQPIDRQIISDPSAIFVLQSWIESGGDLDQVACHVYEWLQMHGCSREASFLMVAWLNRGGDTDQIAPYLHKWLQLHGATQDANFVITSWLKNGGDREQVAPYMHEWLQRFGRT